ncbi:hypothetical protein [Armatimonas sp.]|uniref:hypothetical protein n=1 Tax=Armatimonas sp. TaxID=1872638 RepID=UPI00286AB429|nr:hypothetical protein [Armatimonas sp.]
MRSRLSPHPETIEEYSDALRQHLAGTIPPEKIEEVVAETQAHLEDSAAELRYQADVYERQAIAHFVPVSKLSRGISRAWAPVFLRHSGTKALQNANITLAVLGLTWGMIGLSFGSKFPAGWAETIGFWIPVLLPLCLTFFLALAACRPQARRFTFGGLAAIIACALWGGWKFTGALPNRIFHSRFDAPTLHADITAASNLRSEEVALLRKGIRHYAKYTVLIQKRGSEFYVSQNQIPVPAELKYQGRFIVPRSGFSAFRPFAKSDQPHDFFHQYRHMIAGLSAPLTVSTPEAARKEWGRASEVLKDHLMWQEHDQIALRRYHELITAPVMRFEWASMRSLGTITAAYVGGILFLDLLGGTLGMALLKSQRRRRQSRQIGLGV